MTKCFFVLTFLVISFSCNHHPSEKTLEVIFADNKEKFELLVQMANEDIGISRLSNENIFYSENSKTISAERAREYRQLFQQLRISSGFSRYDRESVAFIVSSDNSKIFDRSSTAILYSTKEHKPLVDSIDEFVKYTKQDPVYKILDKNWYLVYEAW